MPRRGERRYQDTLGSEHQAEIWAVGTQEQTDKHLKNIATLLDKLESRGFASDGNGNGELPREVGTLNRRAAGLGASLSASSPR
jgi:hypothetical protein